MTSKAVFYTEVLFPELSVSPAEVIIELQNTSLRNSLGLSLGLSQIHFRSTPDYQSLKVGSAFKLSTRDAVTPNNLKGTKDFGAREHTLTCR